MKLNETINRIQDLPEELSKGLTGKRREVFEAARAGRVKAQ
jgi:hypothetical protein